MVLLDKNIVARLICFNPVQFENDERNLTLDPFHPLCRSPLVLHCNKRDFMQEDYLSQEV